MWKTKHLSCVDNFPRESMRFPHPCQLTLQGGTPPVVSRFIFPINYRYNPLINPSYWSVAAGGSGGRLLLQARDRAVRRLRALRVPLPQQPLLSRGRVPSGVLPWGWAGKASSIRGWLGKPLGNLVWENGCS